MQKIVQFTFGTQAFTHNFDVAVIDKEFLNNFIKMFPRI